MNRYADAITAYRNAIRLEGASAPLEAGLGEALAAAGGGMVSADAEAAFRKALQLDPKNAKARFFLATGLAQEGRVADAAAGWHAMLADLPADSPWREAANEALAQISARDKATAAAAGSAASGPTEADMKSAASMAPSDREQMIEGMVARLDEKLRKNPDDPEGWRRLVRSYMVLGKAGAARDALQRGKSALGSGSDAARELDAFAASLGIARTE
jgi:cytochrome c-type biogenesis protein CcmH